MRILLPPLAALGLLAATTAGAVFEEPIASLSPNALVFAGQSMQTTSPAQAITVTNTGNATLVISGVSVSHPDFAQTNNCLSLAVSASCTITVTFTPAAGPGPVNFAQAIAGTLTVASNGAGSPNVASLDGTSEKSLVTHYYRSILGRAPDAGGLAFWQGEAARVTGLGASVNEVWFALSAAFYVSAEYAAFNRDNTGFVTDLYNTFFNRTPDPGGLGFWKGQLDTGLPREVALAAFMFSTEFANFTGAIFGSAAARAETNTIVDFYRGLLARLPDGGGFGFWAGRFRTAQCQGSGAIVAEVEGISSAYALSAEYLGRNRTNAQYVGDLYNAFLRRGGDQGGVGFWIGEINSGARTREQVRVEFKNSPEFQARVTAILGQGCLPAPVAPTADSDEATEIGANAATLNATVDDNRASATVAFELGLTTAYGTSVAAIPGTLGPAAGPVPVTGRITGLACGSTYHFRVTAQNASGGAAGADRTFATSPCPAAPTATTNPATDVVVNGARLNGVANDNRAAASITFEYGTSVSYGSSVAAVPGTLAVGAGSTVVSASVAGLNCGTDYHFRLKAVNPVGNSVGADQAFRTNECASICLNANVLCVATAPGVEQEFATIQAALDVANPGDTVLVHDGTYGGVTMTRSGTAGNPIVIRAKGANAVIGSPNAATPPSGIRIQNASYITVEGFRIDNIAPTCHGLTARMASAAAPMRGITFRNNTVNNCETNVFVSQLAESLIERNTITNSRGHGVFVTSAGSDDTTVRGNVIAGSALNGLYFDASDSVLGAELQTGIVVEYNTIRANGQSGIHSDGLRDSTIRNNLIHHNALHGIRALRGGALSGPENLRIVGNTIAGVPGAGGRAAIKFTHDMGGHTIFNNVLQAADGAIHVSHANFKSNRNALAGSLSIDGGTTVLTMALWRALAGAYDVDSVTATAPALFVNPASDFRLAGGSPAANAGVASYNGVAAPAVDLLAVPRPQGGAHDIGAFESF